MPQHYRAGYESPTPRCGRGNPLDALGYGVRTHPERRVPCAGDMAGGAGMSVDEGEGVAPTSAQARARLMMRERCGLRSIGARDAPAISQAALIRTIMTVSRAILAASSAIAVSARRVLAKTAAIATQAFGLATPNSVLLEFFARQSGKAVAGFTPEAEAAIAAYAWPGNVRELRNAVERGVILTPGPEIGLEHLPGQLDRRVLANASRSARRSRWTNSRPSTSAAWSPRAVAGRGREDLGIDPSTLYRKRKNGRPTGDSCRCARASCCRSPRSCCSSPVLGAAGSSSCDRTGGRIDAILRENYASVQAMFRLNEALERMDSSFQFALAAGDEARTPAKQFEDNWRGVRRAVRHRGEQHHHPSRSRRNWSPGCGR